MKYAHLGTPVNLFKKLFFPQKKLELGWQGGILSLLSAIVIGVRAGTLSVALGLLLTIFARIERQAVNLGVLIGVPVSFFDWGIFPAPEGLRRYAIWAAVGDIWHAPLDTRH